MKKQILAALCVSFLVLGLPYAPPLGAQTKATVTVENSTPVWVWVTVYTNRDHKLGWYCIGPRRTETRHYAGAAWVLGEITHYNCAHPVYAHNKLPVRNGQFTGYVFEYPGGNPPIYVFSTHRR